MRLQKAFGYSYEDIRDSIMHMAANGSEATSAMGIDVPLAALSDHHQPLFNYFKQLFAQVTNPPIDAIREKVVTSTSIFIGKDGNLLEEKPGNCCVMRINNPILTNTDLLKIKAMKKEGFKVEVLPIIYYKNTSLERAIDRLFVEADRAYRDMLQKLGPEFSILREIPLEAIGRVSGGLIAEGISKLRRGEALWRPGFDGEYGKLRLFTPSEMERLAGQTSLFGEKPDQTLEPAGKPLPKGSGGA